MKRGIKITERITNANSEAFKKYLSDVSNISTFKTASEEADCAEKAVSGDEKAMQELINRNLRFVISVAKQYQISGVHLEDLINEGNLGMLKAATRFDHTRGFRFISYAVWWVRQSIIQSLNDNSRTIRLPSNVVTKMSQIKRELEKFEGENLTEEKEFLSALPKCSSLNRVINEDGGELSDLIEDTYNNPSEGFYDVDSRLKGEIIKVLDLLSDRERNIVRLYFGIDSEYESMTLEAIGDMYGITKERVRQIKEKAIRKIRHNADGLFDALHE